MPCHLVKHCRLLNAPPCRSLASVSAYRQTLLFSATMPRRVERLAADALTSPIRITVGEVGGANEDIKQVGFCGQLSVLPHASPFTFSAALCF